MSDGYENCGQGMGVDPDAALSQDISFCASFLSRLGYRLPFVLPLFLRFSSFYRGVLTGFLSEVDAATLPAGGGVLHLSPKADLFIV